MIYLDYEPTSKPEPAPAAPALSWWRRLAGLLRPRMIVAGDEARQCELTPRERAELEQLMLHFPERPLGDHP